MTSYLSYLKKGITTYYLRQNKIMGQQTYYNLKNSKGNLGTETIEKLCRLLECQPGDLMEYIPDSKMYYIVSFLQGAAIPEKIPNEETIASIQELESGGGTLFTGSTEDFFSELMKE